MKTVTSRKELRHCQEKYVMVLREDLIYQRVDDEYLPKPYFITSDIVDILQKPRHYVHKLYRKLGIQAEANKRQHIRIKLKQLRQMAEII